MSPLVVAVVGPTATGKSDLALDLAEHLGADVLNADAMQLYRGMDIGTAKLAVDERRGIEHHMLDVLDVEQDASVAAYQRDARAQVDLAHARGRRVVAVGGSGLYVRALLDHLSMAPSDPVVRSALEERAERDGPGVLHDELARLDPPAAHRIPRTNTRRIVRALEVIALTGEPWTAELPEPQYEVPAVQIGLDTDRAMLDSRIAVRVERMWELGLLDEVRGLAGRLGRTASRAVGYAQVLSLLAGECTAEQARTDVAVATRRLARKQMGWFGRDPRVHWLDARRPDLVEEALRLVARADMGTLVDPGTRRRTLGS
ncbi:tRNA (adenosine(37)-N6)-dimethylallyltransferase MiaA [Actinotalea sp.]|uniref:tRNA (adenosine(37)-N6)-dimethylallyltransferase MiaA n=1 Tax=Actinotalea sp. TaxID=1872145 RepID=UPI0035681128